jgi:hypothetical protein
MPLFYSFGVMGDYHDDGTSRYKTEIEFSVN